MRKLILIISLCLLPLIAVSIYAATHHSAKKAPSKRAAAPTAIDKGTAGGDRGAVDGSEAFLNLPGSAGYIDSAGKPVNKPQPKVEIPKVDGVGVSGGFRWNNRSSVVRNSISFAKDLASVDRNHPEATFAKMSKYMTSGALTTAKTLVDPSSAADSNPPKLKYVFLYDDEQTGGQKGKLIYTSGLFFAVEYAPDGKILQLSF